MCNCPVPWCTVVDEMSVDELSCNPFSLLLVLHNFAASKNVYTSWIRPIELCLVLVIFVPACLPVCMSVCLPFWLSLYVSARPTVCAATFGLRIIIAALRRPTSRQ